MKHEFNKLGFNDLGFNNLISTTLTVNNPHFQQPLDSTTLRFNKKKSRIRETKNLLTDADSSTDAKKLLSIFFVPLPAAVAKGL